MKNMRVFSGRSMLKPADTNQSADLVPGGNNPSTKISEGLKKQFCVLQSKDQLQSHIGF